MPGLAERIVAFLTRAEIPCKRIGDDRVIAQLRGERKLTIPLAISISEDRVVFESFFMRRPQENAQALYEMLLRRNRRAYGLAFALDAEGDVVLRGARAVAGLDDDELDRILGSLLVEADGTFDAAIATGFASYLEADMAWRARQGPQA